MRGSPRGGRAWAVLCLASATGACAVLAEGMEERALGAAPDLSPPPRVSPMLRPCDCRIRALAIEGLPIVCRLGPVEICGRHAPRSAPRRGSKPILNECARLPRMPLVPVGHRRRHMVFPCFGGAPCRGGRPRRRPPMPPKSGPSRRHRLASGAQGPTWAKTRLPGPERSDGGGGATPDISGRSGGSTPTAAPRSEQESGASSNQSSANRSSGRSVWGAQFGALSLGRSPMNGTAGRACATPCSASCRHHQARYPTDTPRPVFGPCVRLRRRLRLEH